MSVETLFGNTALGTLTADPAAYSMGMEISLSNPGGGQVATLTGIRFWSPAGAGALPSACGLFAVATQQVVPGTLNTSAVWDGAAGSGWVKCTYDGSIQLTPGVNYRPVVFYGGGSNWYGPIAHYWDTGPGANGLTSGIINAPGAATADMGQQDAFIASSSGIQYPTTSFNSANYGVDLEITTVAPSNVTSKTIVRTGIARYFGGTNYDTLARAYRGNGPLLAAGLSTVRAYQSKRVNDRDYVLGQAAGRGMGALMVVEMPVTKDNALTVGQIPATLQGQRKLVYPVQCHFFHMAHMDYAEDAEKDVDDLDQTVHEHIYTDPTLGGICYQAGMSSSGIRSTVDPSSDWKEITVTHFRVDFDAELMIVV